MASKETLLVEPTGIFRFGFSFWFYNVARNNSLEIRVVLIAVNTAYRCKHLHCSTENKTEKRQLDLGLVVSV